MYGISFLIVVIGISNTISYIKESQEKTKLERERLILTDLKIKFEISASLTEKTGSSHIVGSRLAMKIYSRKDTLMTPFYLLGPTIWYVSALQGNVAKVDIVFESDPEIPVIGKRIKFLEKYDGIEFPLGAIVRRMPLSKVHHIIEVTEVVYINGIEIRKVELPIGNRVEISAIDRDIIDRIASGWWNPFRNCEEEYLNALRKSSNTE